MSPVGDTQLLRGGRVANKQKKREAQDRVLALISQGATVEDACKQVNRHRQTFYAWCKDEEWFLRRYEALKQMDPDLSDDDFVKFRQTYFGFSTPGHQQRIVDVIESAEPGSITMILLPPGGGKTTVLGDYYNYKLAYNPNWRFCVISESQFHSRKILGNVANRMTDRNIWPAYIDRFGPFKANDRDIQRKWGADAIQLVNADSGERDYSIESKGAGTSIYGGSFDDIILDDIQSHEKLNTTDKLIGYFQNTLYSRVMRANTKGRIFIVGTRQGQGDFYEELLRLDIVDQLVKIPALDEHGNSYFPPRQSGNDIIGFSEEDLKKIRGIVGEDGWSRQFMQEPVSKRSQSFSPAMIEKCRNKDRGIDPFRVPGVLRIASLDPALGGHAVFTVAGMDYEKLYLLDGRNEEGLARYEDMWEIMEELTKIWQPSIWIIEGNAIQGGIARGDQVQNMAEKYGFSIQVHQTNRNKMDDIIGVKSMAGTFLRGEIDIPDGDDGARSTFAPLVSELLSWREDVPTKMLRQDEVMALWFIHLHWYRMKSTLANRIDRRMNIGGLPWRTGGLPGYGRKSA